jgi:hypothetical protein
VPAVHASNPRYSGGRDQEALHSKSAQANSLRDSISKNPSQERAGRVAQVIGPEFKPQYCQSGFYRSVVEHFAKKQYKTTTKKTTNKKPLLP